MGKRIDLTGQRFGRWQVLEIVGYKKGVYWLCRCDCGNVKEVRSDRLRDGRSTSCGCFKNEVTAKETGAKIRKHGKWNTRIYHIWQHMKQRCSPSCPKHEIALYYERGIKVCDEWLDNFEAFYEWSIAHGYQDELSIDRIDPNGDYCPDNCRWATAREQTNNRRNTRYIEYEGQRMTLSDVAMKTGIPYSTLSTGLARGRTLEQIIRERET
jgi:hypothetical protein